MTHIDKISCAKPALATYPSLSDVERVVKSKKDYHSEKNISTFGENLAKVNRIGWNDPKVHEMLNYEGKSFQSSANQAEPQQSTQYVGWQIPPKIDIDTVDGVGRYNIVSNMENKNTPVKTELIHQTSKSKKTPQLPGCVWSQHFRRLSPWSNKNQIRKSNLRSTSKGFLESSRKKILRLVSPKKDNKEGVIKIRKTPYRNVAIQTSQEDFEQQPYVNLQSPPGSYHSPMQSSQQQSLSLTESQNATRNEIESDRTDFDFSRHVHSPPKKPYRSSQRKLNFPINCSLPCTEQDNMQSTSKDIKTYRSFSGELDQDVSLSNVSRLLSNIRATLEASDEHAIRTFRVRLFDF